jgi:hypothetical protein
MENDIILPPPEFKLYNDRAVYIATFFGGPLAAGYLASENFKAFGQHSMARNSWLIAFFATIIIFGSAFVIPGLTHRPTIIIPILYSVFAQFLVKHYQGKSIASHIDKGGLVYPVWRAVLLGLIGLAISVVILFFVVLATGIRII